MTTTVELFATGIHPRLFFGPADVAALRARAGAGAPAAVLAELLRRATAACTPGERRYLDPTAGRAALLARAADDRADNTGSLLHCVAFAAVATGAARWTDAGRALLRTLTDVPQPDGGFHTNGLGGELPLAFDLLASAMTPAEREQVATFLRRGVVEPYQRDVLAHPTRYVWGLGTNTFIHGFEQYVFALAAVYDPARDAAALATVAELTRRSLHHLVDEGGAIGEGPSYGWGDALWLTTTAYILRRAGRADLWAEEPRLHALFRHWAYLVLPGGRGQNAIGDAWCFASGRPWWAHLIHARVTGDPVAQWVWEVLGGRGTVPGLGTAPDYFHERLGYGLIWEDDAARAQRPAAPAWPLGRSSGVFGVNVLRSGWGEDDVYFSLLAAGRTPGCHIHQHLDGGHFTLAALGEWFSLDSGYGDLSGRYHSLMRPEGKDPDSTPGYFTSMRTGGRTVAFADGAGAAYACVDTAWQWGCIWNFRHALMVRAPGADPYVVLLDNQNYRNEHTWFEWLMQVPPGNRVAVDEPALRATVQGRQHRLEVAWALPHDGDYPLPHRLDVTTDTLDSFQLSHRRADVNYFLGVAGKERPQGGGRWGAGVRPRLKATLWGYNGMLLTALVPRRAGAPAVGVQRLSGPLQFGLVLDHGDVVDTITASPVDRRQDLGGVTGEAALMLVRRDRAGAVRYWAAADAFHLAVDGRDVLPRRGAAAALGEGGAG